MHRWHLERLVINIVAVFGSILEQWFLEPYKLTKIIKMQSMQRDVSAIFDARDLRLLKQEAIERERRHN